MHVDKSGSNLIESRKHTTIVKLLSRIGSRFYVFCLNNLEVIVNYICFGYEFWTLCATLTSFTALL